MNAHLRAPIATQAVRLGVVLIALVLGLAATPAYAATFVVATTDDAAHTTPLDGTCTSMLAGGDCSLRAAVQAVNFRAVNGDPGPHTIQLAAAGTYQQSVTGVAENAGATGDLDVNGAQ